MNRPFYLKHLTINLMMLCISAPIAAQPVILKRVSQMMIMKAPPFPSCHASTITQLDKNRLMAAWFGGKQEGSPDVCIWIAIYDHGNWGNPQKTADGVINDSLRYPCWNPVLFRTRAGKLFLYYKVGRNPREWWGMMKTSSDNGQSWSAPERLPADMIGPVKNKPIQLNNGDILSPSSTESTDQKQWHIHLERSDSTGSNWREIAIGNDTFGVIQPSILKYGGDSLQMLCRSRQNHIVQTWSKDNGITWGPLSVTALPNPNSGADAVTLQNGVQLLVYNPLTAGQQWWEGRSKLYVAASTDGIHWQDVFELENKPQGEYSYPAIIQAEDGTVHITYTADRKNIRHVMLKVAKTKDGK